MSGFRLNRCQVIGGSGLARLTILVLTAVVLAACGGGGALDQPAPAGDDSTPPAASPQQPDLTLPLDVQRQVSANHYSRLRLGSDFDPTLPHDRMAAEGTFAVFWPDWDPAALPPSYKPAYAVYNFYLDDRDGRPLVIFCWETPPESWDDLAVGVANWQEGRWEWHRGPADDLLELEALEPYVSEEGVLLVMVMLTGTEECVLKWIQGPRLGINQVVITPGNDYCHVEVDYLISDLLMPVVVEANLDFDPSAGRTPSEAFSYSGIISADTAIHAEAGLYLDHFGFPDIPIGHRLVAIRVTDFDGDSDVMWYPWKVWFFPE